MKKIFACLIALLIATTLLGCGQQQQAPQGDASHPTPKEQSKKADEGG